VGTIAISAILDRAQTTLIDEDNVRWAREELLAYYNAAVRFITGVKLDSYVTTAALELAEGSRQSLPEGGTAIRAVTRNMGPDGETPGPAITPVDRVDLDLSKFDWHTTAGDEVEHVVFDQENPTVFYVYPQCSGFVECVYSDTPAVVEDDEDDDAILPIADKYEPVIVDYIVGLAFQKNSESNDFARADWYAGRVASALGLKHQGQFRFVSAPDKQVASAQ